MNLNIGHLCLLLNTVPHSSCEHSLVLNEKEQTHFFLNIKYRFENAGDRYVHILFSKSTSRSTSRSDILKLLSIFVELQAVIFLLDNIWTFFLYKDTGSGMNAYVER